MRVRPGVLIFLFPCSTLAGAFPDPDVLRVGQSISGVLSSSDPILPDHGPSKRFDFVADADGPVTLSLESYDFDAFLRVETEGGEVLVEDHDGGVETNARVVLAASPGARYRIVAAAAEGGAGAFDLSVRAGELPAPSGPARLDAAIAFRSKAAARAVENENRASVLGHRLREALLLSARSDFANARSAYEASLGLARDIGDRPREAAAHQGLGVVFHALGDDPKAAEHHEHHLRLAREIGDRAGEAAALGNLGNLHYRRGDFEKARSSYERAVALSREQGDLPGEAIGVGNLGVVYRSLGQYGRAREHHERHLVLARAIGDRAGEAMALGNLGVLYRIEGEYPKALEHHAQQLAIARQIGDKAVEASTLGNLGNVHYLLGDFANALQYHEQHLLLARALGTLPSEARALENVGATYHALGEYSKARQSIQDSLALARETGHRSSEASALGNLGNVYLSLGQYTRATEQYAQALDIAREIGEPETEATVLGNLGSLHYRLGDRRKALECYEDSLRLAREIGNRLGETRAIANLGNIYDSLGEHANARDHYERYLSLAREIGDRAGEAEVLGSLGGTLFGLGESAKSREACEQSLALFESLGIEEGALIPLAILARLLLAEGGVDEAYRELTKAQRILERPEFRSLETGEASSLRSQFAMWGEIAQDVTARRLVRGNLGLEGLTRVIREGFSQAGAWKGRALLEGIVEHRRGGRSRATIGLLRERREFHAKHEATLRRLSEAIRQGKSSEVIQGLRSEAEALRAHADRVSARLGEGSPPDAAVDLPPAGDPDALRVTVLDSATALVEYAPGEKSLYAYLLTRDRLEFIDLGENDAVDGEVRDFLAVVAVPAAGPGGVERLEAAGRRLFDRLLAPVLARTTERWEGILIVPSTSLAALPFEALVIGTKARGPRRSFADLEFVLDRYEITYAPSSPVLVELAGTGGRGGESKMLVLADPTLASGDLPVVASASSEGAPERVRGVARITPALEEFGRLPNTRREALAIAEVLSRHDTNRKAEIERGLNARSGSLSWPDFELRLGSQARPPRVDEELRSYSVLHLAAHGIVDRELPQRTGIALAPGGGPDDDGFLAIADVLELDLDADLVTLSACETARGASLRGEGIQSMARAFLYAGARSVVASLWLVEDEATAETMEGFYRRYLKEGMAPARALREAKLSLRKGVLSSSDARERGESVHPYFWAPFIYIGLP